MRKTWKSASKRPMVPQCNVDMQYTHVYKTLLKKDRKELGKCKYEWEEKREYSWKVKMEWH